MEKNHLDTKTNRLKTALLCAGINSEDSVLDLVSKLNTALQEKEGNLTVDEIIAIRQQNTSVWEAIEKANKKAEKVTEKEEGVLSNEEFKPGL